MAKRAWTDPHCGYNPSICPHGDLCADCAPPPSPPPAAPTVAGGGGWEADEYGLLGADSNAPKEER